MGTKTLEANVVCVSDYEDDYIAEVNPKEIPKGFSGGITRFIKDAGGGAIREGEAHRFFYPRNLEDTYQPGTVPTVMRVKVTVEVENLSPEESATLWLEYREKAVVYWNDLESDLEET